MLSACISTFVHQFFYPSSSPLSVFSFLETHTCFFCSFSAFLSFSVHVSPPFSAYLCCSPCHLPLPLNKCFQNRHYRGIFGWYYQHSVPLECAVAIWNIVAFVFACFIVISLQYSLIGRLMTEGYTVLQHRVKSWWCGEYVLSSGWQQYLKFLWCGVVISAGAPLTEAFVLNEAAPISNCLTPPFNRLKTF